MPDNTQFTLHLEKNFVYKIMASPPKLRPDLFRRQLSLEVFRQRKWQVTASNGE